MAHLAFWGKLHRPGKERKWSIPTVKVHVMSPAVGGLEQWTVKFNQVGACSCCCCCFLFVCFVFLVLKSEPEALYVVGECSPLSYIFPAYLLVLLNESFDARVGN